MTTFTTVFQTTRGKRIFEGGSGETVYPNNQFQVWCLRAQHKNTRKYTSFKESSIRRQNFMRIYGPKKKGCDKNGNKWQIYVEDKEEQFSLGDQLCHILKFSPLSCWITQTPEWPLTAENNVTSNMLSRLEWSSLSHKLQDLSKAWFTGTHVITCKNTHSVHCYWWKPIARCNCSTVNIRLLKLSCEINYIVTQKQSIVDAKRSWNGETSLSKTKDSTMGRWIVLLCD